MSVKRESSVWCDGIRADGRACDRWRQVEGSPSEARRSVAVDGWSREGEKDFCKECTHVRAQKGKR